jgi:septum formation protein
MNWLQSFKIILASASPRRAELMKMAGFNFEVKTIEVDESYPAELAPEEVAEFLAIKKANGQRSLLKESDQLILTADSVVIKDNIVLGKPKSFEEAKNMIQFLAGDKHKVISGVCLLSKTKQVSFSVSSVVFMTNISEQELDYYIENYKPYDKAGSYGIQEWIGLTHIQKIDGSYSNIMGLPMHEVYTHLKAFHA